ncbi:MAG: DUF4296 domain-containing protein [Bacteroidia bacterium]
MLLHTKIRFCLICLLCFTACQDPQALKNYHKGIVPLDSMEVLLAEVHIIESYRNRGYQISGKDTLSVSRVKALYEESLDKYGISIERFLDSYAYYKKQHPVVLDSLYEGVNRRLNELLSESYQ